MEKINKGIYLYPTEKQKELIEKSFGCSRYIYNYFLNKNNEYTNSYYKRNTKPNKRKALVKESR